jgi:hypothetical protein
MEDKGRRTALRWRVRKALVIRQEGMIRLVGRRIGNLVYVEAAQVYARLPANSNQACATSV